MKGLPGIKAGHQQGSLHWGRKELECLASTEGGSLSQQEQVWGEWPLGGQMTALPQDQAARWTTT